MLKSAPGRHRAPRATTRHTWALGALALAVAMTPTAPAAAPAESLRFHGTVEDEVVTVHVPALTVPPPRLDAGFAPAGEALLAPPSPPLSPERPAAAAPPTRLTRAFVREGDAVRVGAPLAQFDDRSLVAALALADADVEVAARGVDVVQVRIADTLEAEADLRDKREEVRDALARIAQAREKLQDARASARRGLEQVDAALAKAAAGLAKLDAGLAEARKGAATLGAKRAEVAATIRRLEATRVDLVAQRDGARAALAHLEGPLPPRPAPSPPRKTPDPPTTPTDTPTTTPPDATPDPVGPTSPAPRSGDPTPTGTPPDSLPALTPLTGVGVHAAPRDLTRPVDPPDPRDAARRRLRAALARLDAAIARLDAGLDRARRGAAALAVTERHVRDGLARARSARERVVAGQAKGRAARGRITEGLTKIATGLARLDAGERTARDGLERIDEGLDAVRTARRQLRHAERLGRVGIDSARLQQRSARLRRDLARVAAPVPGVVVAAAAAGDVLSPGATLARIRPDGPARVTTWIPPERAALLCVGDAARLTGDWSRGAGVDGRITSIGSDASYPPTRQSTDAVHLARAVPVVVTATGGRDPAGAGAGLPAGAPVDVAITPCRPADPQMQNR